MVESENTQSKSSLWKSTWFKALAGCLSLFLLLCCCLLLAGGLVLQKRLAPQPVSTPESFPTAPYRPSLVFVPSSLPSAQVGQPYTVEIRIEKNVTPVADMLVYQSELPAGLTFEFSEETRTGILSGTPTQAGQYTFSIYAACFGTMVSGQNGIMEYTLIVQ